MSPTAVCDTCAAPTERRVPLAFRRVGGLTAVERPRCEACSVAAAESGAERARQMERWRAMGLEQSGAPPAIPGLRPYYEHAGVTLYRADARDVLPCLETGSFAAVITDPVWPNASLKLAGSADPWGLWASVVPDLERLAPLLITILGCDSDPRFLAPITQPFIRASWLRYVMPSYWGKLLRSADVAYVFGAYPPLPAGRRCFPGEVNGVTSPTNRRRTDHPSARRPEHLQWLVNWWAAGRVLDPFAGTGTTLRAAKNKGLPAVGIEIEERYCELVVRSLEQEVLAL